MNIFCTRPFMWLFFTTANHAATIWKCIWIKNMLPSYIPSQYWVQSQQATSRQSVESAVHLRIYVIFSLCGHLHKRCLHRDITTAISSSVLYLYKQLVGKYKHNKETYVYRRLSLLPRNTNTLDIESGFHWFQGHFLNSRIYLINIH